MANIEQRFRVYVLTPSGDDAFEFDMKYEVSEFEKKIIDSIEEGGTALIDNEELAILYSLLDQKAYDLALEEFWDKNPDAPDDAFTDYQVIVDI